MMKKKSILVLGSPGGGSQKKVGKEKILQGLLGVEPCFCAWPCHPILTAPKDVATLSLKVLKDSESAARPVGRYLLHANIVVCLVLLPSCHAGLLLHVVFCVNPAPPHHVRGSGLGLKSYPR